MVVLHDVYCLLLYFMNHCNPDSSTKAHISSHKKHVFFNNSSLQKIHISSHPAQPSFTKVHISSHAPQMLRNIWNLLRNISLDQKPKNKKPKNQRIPAMVGARIGFLGFGFCMFLVFWFLVLGSQNGLAEKCMSSIKVHCKYQWF